MFLDVIFIFRQLTNQMQVSQSQPSTREIYRGFFYSAVKSISHFEVWLTQHYDTIMTIRFG